MKENEPRMILREGLILRADDPDQEEKLALFRKVKANAAKEAGLTVEEFDAMCQAVASQPLPEDPDEGRERVNLKARQTGRTREFVRMIRRLFKKVPVSDQVRKMTGNS